MEIKDVRLPVQLQRAMAAEAEAAREARAKVSSIITPRVLLVNGIPQRKLPEHESLKTVCV